MATTMASLPEPLRRVIDTWRGCHQVLRARGHTNIRMEVPDRSPVQVDDPTPEVFLDLLCRDHTHRDEFGIAAACVDTRHNGYYFVLHASSNMVLCHPVQPKFGIQELNTAAHDARARHADSLIVVTGEGSTSRSWECINDLNMAHGPLRIECFDEASVRANPLGHVRTCPLRILSPAEQHALLKSKQWKVNQLPELASDDPTISLLGARPWTVVEVTQPDREYHTPFVTWRVVR